MTERFRSRVLDVQGMQIVLEKDGRPFVIDGRGDRDVMTAESARHAEKLVEVQVDAGTIISLHPVG